MAYSFLMNKTTGKPGVYFQDTLPVLWTNTGRPLKESDLHHQHQANEMLLAALLALDETTAEREEDEIARGKEHHWQRIDSKLNLLLSLVSEVLVKQLGIPPCRDVRLCATQIEISLLDSDQPPRLGELLELRTYLQAAIPKPLILNGKVESCSCSKRPTYFGV